MTSTDVLVLVSPPKSKSILLPRCDFTSQLCAVGVTYLRFGSRDQPARSKRSICLSALSKYPTYCILYMEARAAARSRRRTVRGSDHLPQVQAAGVHPPEFVLTLLDSIALLHKIRPPPHPYRTTDGSTGARQSFKFASR